MKQFRALSPLSQLLSCIFLALYAMDFSTTWNDALCLHLTLLGALARPWTLVTCQLVSPTVLEIPAIVGLVFLVEILLKRAYVGSRVVCELLLTTAVVTGGLYVLFDAFHRTVISGEEAGTPLALGPHSLVGGALVLCQKLKNDLSDEDTVRRAARYGPVWFLLGAVFIGGEIDREERVFGCALFGVVGGHVYFHARGRFKVLGMHVASTRTARTKSSNVDNATPVASASESKEGSEEEQKQKKLREELGKKALIERLKQKEKGEKEATKKNTKNSEEDVENGST